MITPLEIESKEFSKSLRGYDTKEVDEFMDEINSDYEKIYKENIELKDKIGILMDQIKQYDTLEDTLKSTLVIAQSTADDVTITAKKKADLIVEEAEFKAAEIVNRGKMEVKSISAEYEELKKEMNMFKIRYRSFMTAQLMSIDEFFGRPEEVKVDNLLEEDGDLIV